MVSIIPNWQLPRNPYIFLGETCEDLNMMFFLKIRWSPFPTYTPKTNMEHPPTNLTDFWNKHDVSLKRKKMGIDELGFSNWSFSVEIWYHFSISNLSPDHLPTTGDLQNRLPEFIHQLTELVVMRQGHRDEVSVLSLMKERQVETNKKRRERGSHIPSML